MDGGVGDRWIDGMGWDGIFRIGDILNAMIINYLAILCNAVPASENVS